MSQYINMRAGEYCLNLSYKKSVLNSLGNKVYLGNACKKIFSVDVFPIDVPYCVNKYISTIVHKLLASADALLD